MVHLHLSPYSGLPDIGGCIIIFSLHLGNIRGMQTSF
jgi:hypothetical protein